MLATPSHPSPISPPAPPQPQSRPNPMIAMEPPSAPPPQTPLPNIDNLRISTSTVTGQNLTPPRGNTNGKGNMALDPASPDTILPYLQASTSGSLLVESPSEASPSKRMGGELEQGSAMGLGVGAGLAELEMGRDSPDTPHPDSINPSKSPLCDNPPSNPSVPANPISSVPTTISLPLPPNHPIIQLPPHPHSQSKPHPPVSYLNLISPTDSSTSNNSASDSGYSDQTITPGFSKKSQSLTGIGLGAGEGGGSSPLVNVFSASEDNSARSPISSQIQLIERLATPDHLLHGIDSPSLQLREKEMKTAMSLTIPMETEADKDFFQGPSALGVGRALGSAGMHGGFGFGLDGLDSPLQSAVPLSAASGRFPGLPPVFGRGERGSGSGRTPGVGEPLSVVSESPSLGALSSVEGVSSSTSAGSVSSSLLSATLEKLVHLGNKMEEKILGSGRSSLPESPTIPLPSRPGLDELGLPSADSLQDLLKANDNLQGGGMASGSKANLKVDSPGLLTSSLPGSRGGTPSLPSFERPGSCLITAEGLTQAIKTCGEGKSRLLVLDSRPLGAYLEAHIAHSANVVIPSLILRRCKRNMVSSMRLPESGDGKKTKEKEEPILSGGWDALKGYVSTDGGRKSWEAFWAGGESVKRQIILVAERDDDDTGRVLEEVVKDFLQADEGTMITSRWLSKGWSGSVAPTTDDWTPNLRKGENSAPLDSSAVVNGISGPAPGLTLRVQKASLDAVDLSPGIRTAAPAHYKSTNQPHPPSLQIPVGLANKKSLPTLRHYPLPSLTIPDAPVPSMLSPPPIGMNRAKRVLPKPMRINTLGIAAPPLKTAKKAPPPSLNLKSSNANLSVPAPLKSASMPGPDQQAAGSSKSRSASGNTTYLNVVANREDEPPRTPVTTVNETGPGFGSLQAFCHTQSKLPPSPSTFGGVTRRAPYTHDSPATLDSAQDSYFRSSSASDSSSSSSGYPISPREDDDDDDDGENSREPASFLVSTILPSFLFLGPEITTEAEVQHLLDLGVKRVLNVAVECDDGERLRLSERFDKYTRLPLRDCVEESGIRKGVMDACQFLDDARLHSSPTYVHCKAGKSRSVTVVLGYLIHANAWTLKASYAYVAERRKGISPNIGFVAELMQFEESELGLKNSTGISTNASDDDHGSGGDREGSTAKRNRYARESLPSVWNNTEEGRLDFGEAENVDSPVDDDRAPTPRQAASGAGGCQGQSPLEPEMQDHRGMEKEVRKNGQYVHYRRAPVNKHTLQPMRRVSKAGLESLTFLSPQISPTSIKQREAVTPDEARDAWL